MKVHIPHNENEHDESWIEEILNSDTVGACSLDDDACSIDAPGDSQADSNTHLSSESENAPQERPQNTGQDKAQSESQEEFQGKAQRESQEEFQGKVQETQKLDDESQQAWNAGFAAAEAAVEELKQARKAAEAARAQEEIADAEGVAGAQAHAGMQDGFAGQIEQNAAELAAALAQSKAECAEAHERYMRLQAEWDNFRKRTAAEADANKARAVQKLIEELIPVIDDFERALAHAQSTKPEGEFEAFTQGVDAIYGKVLAVFSKARVEVIDPVEQPFDALEHQAVARVSRPDLPEETVVDVYQKGYKLGGYVMRPAMVSVSIDGPHEA